MRRVLLSLLMGIVLLQLSWAAVAAVCQHQGTSQNTEQIDRAARHFGHHEHPHEHRDGHAKKAAASDTAASVDTDCGTCHGHGTAAFIELPLLQSPPTRDRFAGHYVRHLPDPVPDHLLRPPLTTLV